MRRGSGPKAGSPDVVNDLPPLIAVLIGAIAHHAPIGQESHVKGNKGPGYRVGEIAS